MRAEQDSRSEELLGFWENSAPSVTFPNKIRCRLSPPEKGQPRGLAALSVPLLSYLQVGIIKTHRLYRGIWRLVHINIYPPMRRNRCVSIENDTWIDVFWVTQYISVLRVP